MLHNSCIIQDYKDIHTLFLQMPAALWIW